MNKILFTFVFIYFSFCVYSQYTDWTYLSQTIENTCIEEYGSDLWIGNRTGLVQYNKITGNKTHYDKTNTPLPENFIRCIAIDGNGVKWIGTQFGLTRFDGSSWITYNTSNSPLPNAWVNRLACDENNNVWIWVGVGITKFDGTNWTTYNTSNSSIPSNYINCLFTEGNNVWISSNVLSKFDGTNWTHYNTSNSNINLQQGIQDITKDKSGNIWLSHAGAIQKLDTSGTFTIYNNSNTNLNYIGLKSIAADTNNIIWVGRNGATSTPPGGFMSFDGSTWTNYDSLNTNFNANSLEDILIDSNNEPYGVSLFEGDLHHLTSSNVVNIKLNKLNVNHSQIRNIRFDPNGNPIIGTKASAYQTGLFKYDWAALTPLSHYNDSSYNFSSDKFGNIYVKNRHTVFKFDGVNWNKLNGYPTTYIPIPNNPAIGCIENDTSGGLWVDYLASLTFSGTGQATYHEGLAYYNGSIWTSYSYTNSPLPDVAINQIRIDKSNSNIWLGTSNGLVKFDKVTWSIFTPTNPAIPKNVQWFDIDSIGNIWYSNAAGGFIKFDGTNWTNIISPNNTGGYLVTIDKAGVIWQTHIADILKSYDGTNWVTYSYTNCPFPSGFNFSNLTVDKYNNKWISTSYGVFIFKESTGSITEIKDISNLNSNIIAYPNPFYGQFNIKLNQKYKEVNLKLYDCFGQEIINTNYFDSENIGIETNNLKKGIYHYKIKMGNITKTGKVIAE